MPLDVQRNQVGSAYFVEEEDKKMRTKGGRHKEIQMKQDTMM
jgi:hypothetical protein